MLLYITTLTLTYEIHPAKAALLNHTTRSRNGGSAFPPAVLHDGRGSGLNSYLYLLDQISDIVLHMY